MQHCLQIHALTGVLCSPWPSASHVDHLLSNMQASGEAVYTSDIGVGSGELFAAVVGSTQALATLVSVDPLPALAVCPSAFVENAPIV